jgi:transcriptional regulator with XRE-family HTH domain
MDIKDKFMDHKSTPFPVRRALKKLGQDLSDARKRRRIPMHLAAERASISRMTLSKIEKGDEGVSIGAYARILFVMGLIHALADLADVRFDKLGLDLEAEKLPKRIRFPRRKSEE